MKVCGLWIGIVVAVLGSATASAYADTPGGVLSYIGCYENESLANCSNPPSDKLKPLRNTKAVAVNPDGQSLIAAGNDSDALVTLQINADGTLRQRSSTTSCVSELSAYRTSLSPSSCLTQMRLDAVEDVAYNVDGTAAYAVSAATSTLNQFTVDSNGELSPNVTAALPRACITYDSVDGPAADYKCNKSASQTILGASSVTAGEHAVYVTGSNATVGGITVLDIGSTGGVSNPSGVASCVSPVLTPPTCAHDDSVYASRDSALSPDGKFLYTVGNDSLSIFSVNQTNGHLISSVQCISNDRDGSGGTYAPTVSSCDATTGDILGHATGVYATEDYVFATADGSDALAVFVRDHVSGALTFSSCLTASASAICERLPGLSDPSHVVATDREDNVYVATPGVDGVAVLSFDKNSGVATPLGGKYGCVEDYSFASGHCDAAPVLKDANSLAFSPNQNRLYVGAYGAPSTGQILDGSVVAFDRLDATIDPPTVTEPEPTVTTEQVTTEVPVTEAAVATASPEATVAESCALLARYPSVTHWKWAGKSSARLETKSGAYMYRSRESQARVILKLRRQNGDTAKLKKATFYVDGVKTSSTSKTPAVLTLKPKEMSIGSHQVKATVKTGDGTVKLTQNVYVTGCAPTSYSLATASKIPHARTNLRFWWQAGDSFPTKVKATFPKVIRIYADQLRKYGGRVLGGIQLTEQDGTKRYIKLKIPKSIPASNNVTLLSESSGLKVSFKAQTGGSVEVSGISGNVNNVRVWLRGRLISLFRNVDSCSNASLNSTAEMELKSAAEMASAQSKLKLTSYAKLCSNKR